MTKTSPTFAAVCVCGALAVAGISALQGQTQPTRPRDPLPSPRQPAQPAQPADPNQSNQPNQSADPNRYTGPFMFQSPQNQTAFEQRMQDLLRMEQQFDTRRTELLRRLGEARAMTGERRLDALADVLQQVILDQEQMQQYLIASRTTWTGEATLANQDLDNQRNRNNTPAPNRR